MNTSIDPGAVAAPISSPKDREGEGQSESENISFVRPRRTATITRKASSSSLSVADQDATANPFSGLFDAETQHEWNSLTFKGSTTTTIAQESACTGVFEFQVNPSSPQEWFQTCADAEFELQERKRRNEAAQKEKLFQRKRIPRIGDRYQVHFLPKPHATTDTAYTTNRTGGELVWSPFQVTTDAEEVWEWLEMQGSKVPLALRAVHEAKYSMKQAKEWFQQFASNGSNRNTTNNQSNATATATATATSSSMTTVSATTTHPNHVSSQVLEWHTTDTTNISMNDQDNDTWDDLPSLNQNTKDTMPAESAQQGVFDVQESNLTTQQQGQAVS